MGRGQADPESILYGRTGAREATDHSCESCKSPDGTTYLHECPYQADVNDDPSERCNCCPDCTDGCRDEI